MNLIRGVVAPGFCLLFGCSSQPTGETGPATPGTLTELHSLVHAAAGETMRAPAKLADLNRHQSMFPRAYEAVKSGDVVVLWGTPLQGEGEAGKDAAVLAYEKSVPTAGGYVLMSAGTVKKMTADEFAAAPKSGK